MPVRGWLNPYFHCSIVAKRDWLAVVRSLIWIFPAVAYILRGGLVRLVEKIDLAQKMYHYPSQFVIITFRLAADFTLVSLKVKSESLHFLLGKFNGF
jgi:hypothetical protein